MPSIFDLQLETTDRANALNRRRRKGRDGCLLNAPGSFSDGAHNRIKALTRAGPVMKRLEDHEDRAAIRLRATGENRVPADRDGVIDSRNLAQRLSPLCSTRFGPIQRS